jgi:hypothetical protein
MARLCTQARVKLSNRDTKTTREEGHINLPEECAANMEIADINHLGKGLIPIFTVLNSQAVNRAFHYKEVPKSNAVLLTKKQLTHKHMKNKQALAEENGETGNMARSLSFKKADAICADAKRVLDSLENSFRTMRHS